MGGGLTIEERYVVERILFAESHGKAWAGFTVPAIQEAAIAMARRGLVLVAEAAGETMARRANGVRIEDLA